MVHGHALDFRELGGERHRHQDGTVHSHPHSGRHEHGHSHSHGLIAPSIKRSRAGLRAVGASLAILAATAAIQAAIYVATGSVALLADLIHNFGDALTAVPLGTAFLLRSQRAERYAGLGVVLAIFASACVAGFLAVEKIINPHPPDHLLALAIAGAIGFAGNEVAAQVRLRAGRRLESPALVADGYHARTDGFVSLGVMLSAALVALGLPIADPVIAIVITGVILQITRQSWRTVRGHEHRTSPRGRMGADPEAELTVEQLLDEARAKLDRLTPAQANAAHHDGAILIDIRSELQRSTDGELPGAKRFARNVLEWRLDPNSPDRDPEVARRDIQLIVICNEGYQSSLAAATLQRFGLQATDVIGGFQAWRRASLPIARD